MPVATKVGKILTYLDQLQPINLLDPVILRSYQIT